MFCGATFKSTNASPSDRARKKSCLLVAQIISVINSFDEDAIMQISGNAAERVKVDFTPGA